MKIDKRTTAGYLKALSGLEQLPGPDGQRYVELFHHGTLSIELYAPRGNDPQTPHPRDEIYVIIQGNGGFVRGQQQTTFSAGDVLFVPAGMEHRFVDFSEDFATWVFFYGPDGGEAGLQQ